MLVIFTENGQKVAFDTQSRFMVEPSTGEGCRLTVDDILHIIEEGFEETVKAINDARTNKRSK